MKAATSLAESHSATAYQSISDLIRRESFDAAIVSTPPSTHPEICCELLERGIHVLCEKPVAINLEQAQKMFHVAQVTGAKLTMASKFRHVDDVRAAKSLVDSGIVGEVVLFENIFTANVDMRHRWNSQPEIAGGGVLIDNGTHSVDIMRYLLGPLAELQVIEGKRLQSPAVEDTVKIFVRSTEGVLGDIDLSWSINKGHPAYINLYGSDGTIMVGWKESKFRRAKDKDWTIS
jgi:predicted dehydrogenase